MKWLSKLFSQEPVPTKELQAELKALCMKIKFNGGTISFIEGDLNRYERLLAEIYKRGEEPEITLVNSKT